MKDGLSKNVSDFKALYEESRKNYQDMFELFPEATFLARPVSLNIKENQKGNVQLIRKHVCIVSKAIGNDELKGRICTDRLNNLQNDLSFLLAYIASCGKELPSDIGDIQNLQDLIDKLQLMLNQIVQEKPLLQVMTVHNGDFCNLRVLSRVAEDVFVNSESATSTTSTEKPKPTPKSKVAKNDLSDLIKILKEYGLDGNLTDVTDIEQVKNDLEGVDFSDAADDDKEIFIKYGLLEESIDTKKKPKEEKKTKKEEKKTKGNKDIDILKELLERNKLPIPKKNADDLDTIINAIDKYQWESIEVEPEEKKAMDRCGIIFTDEEENN